MLDFQKYIDLLPDAPFDVSPGSNNYKVIELLVEELNQLAGVYEDISGLTDLQNVFGATLDLYAKDYGVTRDGRTDEELRSFIVAKQLNIIDGNTISNVINYFSLFITPDTNIILTELFESFLGTVLDGLRPLDGTQPLEGAGFRRPGAFDVQTGAITPQLENILTSALPILKSAGIQATVNLLP